MNWLRKAPAERATLPAATVLWVAAAVMHAAHWAPVSLITVAVTVAAFTAHSQAQRASRRHARKPARHGSLEDRRREQAKPRRHARQAATVAGLAGAWLLAAAKVGPLTGPYRPLTLVWGAGVLAAHVMLWRHPVARGLRQWRRRRLMWLREAHADGLAGTHLLMFEATRLGERLRVDTRDTGKTMSHFTGGGVAERMAARRHLPVSRVTVRPAPLAGEIDIHIRELDPWRHPITHPVLAAAPELHLPDPCSIRDPLIVGQDPETGRPLQLILWDEVGAKNVLIVGMKRAGKTTMINCIKERVTACADALLIQINVSKAIEEQHWAPACAYSAIGRDQRARARRLLHLARRIIDERPHVPRDTAVLQPEAARPAVVVMIDEVDALFANDGISHGIKQDLAYIASKNGSEGVILIIGGQRATAEWIGGGDIRSQIETVCLGHVNRRGEAMHAAGDLGLQAPDMSTYGEGHKGVWALIQMDGAEMRLGRTFGLHELDGLDHIVSSRAGRPVPQLEPALVQRLGRAYASVTGTGAAAATGAEAGPPPAPVTVLDHPSAGPPPAIGTSGAAEPPEWALNMARLIRSGQMQAPDDATREALLSVLAAHEQRAADALLTEVEDDMPDDVRARFREIDAKNADTRRILGEADRALQGLPDVPPERITQAGEERWRQAASQVDFPSEAQARLLVLLAAPDGTTISRVAADLGVKPYFARCFLERLRAEGLAVVEGKGRGSRWRAAPDSPGADDAG